jgi:hypothetical protein
MHVRNRADYVAPILALCSITAVLVTLVTLALNGLSYLLLPPRLAQRGAVAFAIELVAVALAVIAAIIFTAASMSATSGRNTAGYVALLLWMMAMTATLLI